MTEPDPLDRLSRIANQPEPPAPEFRDRLLDELLGDLTADRATGTDSSFDHTTNEPTLEVIMLSPDRSERPTTSRRWMMVAAAVAALALVGGLIFAGTRADEDQVPADQPEPTLPAEPVDQAEPVDEAEESVSTAPAETPAAADDAGALAIGEAMISAVNERDTAAAAALLADDATVEVSSARNEEDLLKLIDFFAVDGTNFDLESCQPGSVYPVTCTAEFTNELSQARDGDPITGTFYFRIADGQISALALNMDRNFGDQVMGPWLTFIEEQHPEDFDKMIRFDADGFVPLGPQLTEESSTLHAAYIAEYVAAITTAPAETPAAADDAGALAIGEAMISAVNERDTAAAAALLADDATVEVSSARNEEDLLKLIDFFAVDGTNFDLESCQPGSVYPVTCTAEFTNELSQARDGDPITGTFYFRIADGQISALALNMDRNFGDQVMGPWLTFIEEQHPEDFDKMIRFDADGFVPLGPQLTEESSTLHAAYIAEYVAAITSE